MQARHDEQRSERERAMTELRETHNRLRGATDFDDDDEESVGGSRGGRYRTADQLNQRKAQRQRYQFEATASDDELEDGIDDGLDDIMETTKRLKNLGAAMGNELDSQNTRLDGITRKTTKVDDMLVHNTNRVCLANGIRPHYAHEEPTAQEVVSGYLIVTLCRHELEGPRRTSFAIALAYYVYHAYTTPMYASCCIVLCNTVRQTREGEEREGRRPLSVTANLKFIGNFGLRFCTGYPLPLPLPLLDHHWR